MHSLITLAVAAAQADTLGAVTVARRRTRRGAAPPWDGQRALVIASLLARPDNDRPLPRA